MPYKTDKVCLVHNVLYCKKCKKILEDIKNKLFATNASTEAIDEITGLIGLLQTKNMTEANHWCEHCEEAGHITLGCISCSCNVGMPKVQKGYFVCPKHGEQNVDKKLESERFNRDFAEHDATSKLQ